MIHSPFGLALRGIRENAVRMPAIGAPSPAHIRKVYTIAAVMAGVAGALLAQTTETVSLETLSFQRSADVLVILILGGAGRLYGGIVGAIIYMVARDQLSGINPQYWYFWIGTLLVAVVIFLPNGILGGLARLMPSVAEPGVSTAALSTRGLDKSFGSLVVAKNIELDLPRGARYALIGPERRRQDHADQPDHRHAAGRTRAASSSEADEVTALRPEERVRRGLVRTFQINTLFPHLSALEAVTLAVCERRGYAGHLVAEAAGLSRMRSRRRYAILLSLRLGASCYRPTRELAYGQQRLLEIALALATRPKVLLLDEPAAGVPQRRERRAVLGDRQTCRRTSRCCSSSTT